MPGHYRRHCDNPMTITDRKTQFDKFNNNNNINSHKAVGTIGQRGQYGKSYNSRGGFTNLRSREIPSRGNASGWRPRREQVNNIGYDSKTH